MSCDVLAVPLGRAAAFLLHSVSCLHAVSGVADTPDAEAPSLVNCGDSARAVHAAVAAAVDEPAQAPAAEAFHRKYLSVVLQLQLCKMWHL